MTRGRDGRVFEPEVVAQTRADNGRLLVLAPQPGLLREAPAPGALVRPHAAVGELEVLGVLHLVRTDAQAHGMVLPSAGPALARRPVEFGQVLFELDPNVSSAADTIAEATPGAATDGHFFAAPSSGRFYSRPAPGKPPFVSEGQVLTAGAPVALLEVMKTFNRITFVGTGLPESARVLRILVQDGDDVEAGQPLLEIEAVSKG